MKKCERSIDRETYLEHTLEQGGDFSLVFLLRKVERGSAVLSWKKQVGAHGREGTKEGVSYEQLSPCRPGSCARFEHAGSIMYY